MKSLLKAVLFSALALNSWAQTDFTISPTTADPIGSFDLHLLTYSFNCGHEYSYKDVELSGMSINLSFLPVETPDVLCPAIYAPYGPQFEIPGLERG